jgi:RND family efflux transporter MFP subunit
MERVHEMTGCFSCYPALPGVLLVLLTLSRVCTSTAQTVAVQVVSPVRQDIRRELRLPGTLKPYEEAALYAKASGYLQEIRVDIGDRVERGDLVARLDIPEMTPLLSQAHSKLQESLAQVSQASSEWHAARAKVEAAIEKAKAIRATARKSEADLNLKKRLFARTEALRRDKAITDQEYDETLGQVEAAQAAYDASLADINSFEADGRSAQAQVEVAFSKTGVAKAATRVAQAEVERIKALASYLEIRAPFPGVVADRYVDPGQLIVDGTSGKASPLLRLVRADSLRLRFDVPEKETPLLEKGCAVSFVPDSLPGHPFHCAVSRLSGELAKESRTMIAEALVRNEEGLLTPGMFVRVTLQLDLKEGALTIPAKALVSRKDGASVWVVQDGMAQLIPIKTGYDDGTIVEVTEGLTENAKVVVSGHGSLKPDMKVEVASSK